MNKTSSKDIAEFEKSSRYCSLALILFSAAIFFLAVGVFTVNPETIGGMAFLVLGLLCMLGCVLFFALYARHEPVSQ